MCCITTHGLHQKQITRYVVFKHIKEFGPTIAIVIGLAAVLAGYVSHVASDPRYATAAAYQPFGK